MDLALLSDYWEGTTCLKQNIGHLRRTFFNVKVADCVQGRSWDPGEGRLWGCLWEEDFVIFVSYHC
jgi:hypothetical protein